MPIINPFINGNAWFVSELKAVENADEAIKKLDKIDTKKIAVFQPEPYAKGISTRKFVTDSLAYIKLTLHKPNHLQYISKNTNNDGFAVFSETYYKNGWKATIDGKEATIVNVDYVLRGLEIPKGEHQIEFKFEPQIVKTGGMIALISSIGMILLIIGVVYFEQRKKKEV